MRNLTLQRPLRPRFVENKIVAIVLALPEPFAVLALMNRGIEFGDREKPLLEDKSSAIAEFRQIRKNILDIARAEMAVFALEHEQWRVLPQDPRSALQYLELGALDVDLEQRDFIVLGKIIVERDHRHRQGRETFRLYRLAMQRGAGLMTDRQIQIPIAGMRIDGLGFDLDVVEIDGLADVGESVRQFRLRLERDHPAMTNPGRQPIDKTALVGADVADDIAGPDVLANRSKFGLLIAKSRFQCADAEAEARGSEPGLVDGHRVRPSKRVFWLAARLRQGFGGAAFARSRERAGLAYPAEAREALEQPAFALRATAWQPSLVRHERAALACPAEAREALDQPAFVLRATAWQPSLVRHERAALACPAEARE